MFFPGAARAREAVIATNAAMSKETNIIRLMNYLLREMGFLGETPYKFEGIPLIIFITRKIVNGYTKNRKRTLRISVERL